jgi:hypothetical protein
MTWQPFLLSAFCRVSHVKELAIKVGIISGIAMPPSNFRSCCFGTRKNKKGMALFYEEFHPRGVFLVGTDGIPIEQFLTMNPAELFKL